MHGSPRCRLGRSPRLPSKPMRPRVAYPAARRPARTGGRRINVAIVDSSLCTSSRRFRTHPGKRSACWTVFGLTSRSGESAGVSGQLADHPVDVPEAVTEHDVVVVLAELVDVPAGLAKKPRRVEKPLGWHTFVFLGSLTPLAAVVDALVDDEVRVCEGPIDVVWPHVRSVHECRE